MNIKSRIKRLEQLRTANDSNYCNCVETYLDALIDAVYDNKPMPKSIEIPEGICPKCSKPVSENTHKFLNDLDLSYGDDSQVVTI